MLDIAQFDDLMEGDLVEAPSIMLPVTKEPLVMHTQQCTPTRKEFVATFFGITLGRWACVKDNEKGTLTWQKM